MKILYEDNHIIVVVKEPGIPSQEDKTGSEDMLTIIKKYLKEKYLKPGNVYLGLVHRLDRNVGGVMVFAKTSKAASRLSEEIRDKKMFKYYLAVVKGKMEKNEGFFEDYLYKNEKENKSYVNNVATEETLARMKNKNEKIFQKFSNKKAETPSEAVKNKSSKYAKLEYSVLEYNERLNMSLVKIKLETGRHHQIRVQFSSRGHALVGDSKYGTRSRSKEIALWAYRLEFIHPTKKEKLVFEEYPKFKGIWQIFDILNIEKNEF